MNHKNGTRGFGTLELLFKDNLCRHEFDISVHSLSLITVHGVS